MYDLEAMKEAIKRCDVNIELFQRAIIEEAKTKGAYLSIVSELEAKAEAEARK